MKNTASRGTLFLSILMNCTVVLLLAIFVATYFYPSPPVAADLKIEWLSRNRGYRMCSFYPNIDLSSQFNFNTKQIFLYLIARTSEREEMVWSKIVKNGESYKLNDLEKSNYSFSVGIDGPLLFELRGNVFPFVGQMKDIHYATVDYRRAK